MKKLLSLLALMLALLCLLCACNNDPTPPDPYPTPTPPPGSEPVERTAHFHSSERLMMSVPFTQLDDLSMPEAPDDLPFVGWIYEVGGERKICAIGEVPEAVNAEGDLHFYALSLRFSSVMTLTPALDEESFSITASINGDDMRTLIAVLGADKVSAGLLIAPYGEVTGPGREFTLECGAAGLVDHKGTPFTAAEGSYTVTGSTGVIAADALLEKFAARAYITYQFMGYTITSYGDYFPLMQTATLLGASALAFEELAATADETFIHAVETAEGTCYSRYTAAEREVLRARLDRAVYVDTANGRVENKYSLNNVDYYDYKYYVSPYEVATVSDELVAGARTYVVTGVGEADHGDLDAYFVGGSYRPPKADEWHGDGLYISVESETA